MRRLALVAAAVMVGASACGALATGAPGHQPPGPPDVVAGRFVRSAELDNGDFKVAPAPRGVRPAITDEEAAILSDADPSASGSGGGRLLGFGVVSVRSGLGVNLQRAPAWVAMVWGRAVGCPDMPGPERPGGGAAVSGVAGPSAPTTAALPPPTPGYVAVIVLDANHVFDYQSRQSVCGEPPSGPTARAAAETLSLPWRLVSLRAGKVVLRYQVPSCSAQVTPSVEVDHASLSVQVSVPFDRADCPETWKQTTAAIGASQNRVVPGPIGPVDDGLGSAGASQLWS